MKVLDLLEVKKLRRENLNDVVITHRKLHNIKMKSHNKSIGLLEVKQ